jgi:two-component system, chemotaxis family, sensor kinase CheA
MNEKGNAIKDKIENLSLQVCMLEEGNIPAMGEILNSLSALKDSASDHNCAAFSNVISGLHGYLSKMVLDEASDTKPLEDGATALQAIWRGIINDKEFTTDISDVLESLGFVPNDPAGDKPADDKPESASGEATEGESQPEAAAENEEQAPKQSELTDEDLDILGDFVVESRENLESIELNLIELEQNPGDMDIINSIFRPFHTIKGVSGFLKLDKMNALCHHTENLIDSARSGDLVIDDDIADMILESLDTLKLMLEDVEKSLDTKLSATFEGIDVHRLTEKIKSAGSAAGEKESIGKILVESGSIEEKDLREGLKIQKSKPDKKIGEILVKEKKIEPADVKTALKKQTSGKGSAGLQVKVDTEKLDNLVDLAGELVIAQSMFKQIGLEMVGNDQKYSQRLNQVTQAVSDIQKIAMSMRMVPIKNTFQKMFRLVRDLARNSGKEADLSMSGEDTEIDRNVVDELYEPMVHMIRNSVDHGLELPDDREAMEKNRKGSIHLRAYQKGGNIVIEIEDDGNGLDKNIILEKAIERNLATEEDTLTDKEIYGFIMHPGFSTAKEITDVSGRGVGMDVVKKGIEKLRGRLDIDSEAGKGSMFTISLPLTLAIVEGMLVRVGKEKYILPAHSILESFRPEEKNCYTVEKKGEMVRHRESLIPIVRIDQLFNVKGEMTNPWEGIAVLAENNGEQKALLLDELLGKEEFVIKNLGETFKEVKGLAGGAILADGKVGLIVDMSGLFQVTAE